MQDDSLTLKFSHTTTVAVPVGSYVVLKAKIHALVAYLKRILRSTTPATLNIPLHWVDGVKALEAV